MPIYISDGLLLSEAVLGIEAGPNSPRIGIQNISNKGNIFDAANTLATNPAWLTSVESTAERWKTTPTAFHIWSMSADGLTDVDYVGIAAHRGLVGRQVEIRCVVGGVLQTVFGPQIIIGSDPIFVLFNTVKPTLVYVVISSGDAFDFEIGIINVGKTVFLPRNIYVDHAPITYGRQTSKQIATGDSGSYLGQRLKKINTGSSVSMDNVPPDFYRDYLFLGFHIPSETKPFFWAWRPQKYPDEIGFVWLNGDFSINNALPNGHMSINFSVTGFVNNG